jgi:hypothetical protein
MGQSRSRPSPLPPSDGRCLFTRLASVEVQLVMQALDRQSKCCLARCNRQLLDELRQPLSWRHANPLCLSAAVQKTDGDVVLSPPRVCVLPAVPPSSLLRHLIPLDLRFAIGGLVDLSALDQLPPMHGIQVHLRTHPEVLRALMQLSSMRRLRCVRLGVYDAVFIDVPSLPQLLSALSLHTLHLFVWRRRHVLGVRPSRRDGLAVLGNGLPLLEELHCDLHSWKVGLCRTALARRVRRLGLPLWQRDKPVSSSFAGLESPLLQLLALQCTKQLEDLALFGAAHMEKRFETVPPLIFRNDQCAPIPIVPDSLHEAGALAPSVGFASLHSLSVLGFRHPQIILANLASSPLPELRLLRVCFHRYTMANPSEVRRMLVQQTAPLYERCHPELVVEVHADARDPKSAQFARTVGKGAAPHQRLRMTFCTGC